jgi:hypothetical protein
VELTQAEPFQTFVVVETKAVPFQTFVVPATKAVPFQTFPPPSTVIVKVPVLTDPDALVALRTKVNTPGTVGVPVMAPVEVFSVRLVGRAPENTE